MPNHLRRFVLKNNYTPLFVDQVRLGTEYRKDTQHTVGRKDLLQHLVCARSTPTHTIFAEPRKEEALAISMHPPRARTTGQQGLYVEHGLYGLTVFLVDSEAKSS